MATAAATINSEEKKMDTAQAFKIYRKDIAPLKSKQDEIKGDMSDPWKQIKDQCHFPKRIMTFIQTLDRMEDSERDHHLQALSEGLKHMKLFLPSDLVNIANGEVADASPVPTGDKPKPKLVTVGGTGADAMKSMSAASGSDDDYSEVTKADVDNAVKEWDDAAPKDAE